MRMSITSASIFRAASSCLASSGLVTPDGAAPPGGRRRRLPQWYGRDARQLDADRRRIVRPSAHGLRHRPLTGAYRIGGSGPIWMALTPTASASMQTTRSGTPTCLTRAAPRVREGGQVLQKVEPRSRLFRVYPRRPGRPHRCAWSCASWHGMGNMADEPAHPARWLTLQAPAPADGYP